MQHKNRPTSKHTDSPTDTQSDSHILLSLTHPQLKPHNHRHTISHHIHPYTNKSTPPTHHPTTTEPNNLQGRLTCPSSHTHTHTNHRHKISHTICIYTHPITQPTTDGVHRLPPPLLPDRHPPHHDRPRLAQDQPRPGACRCYADRACFIYFYIYICVYVCVYTWMLPPYCLPTTIARSTPTWYARRCFGVVVCHSNPAAPLARLHP